MARYKKWAQRECSQCGVDFEVPPSRVKSITRCAECRAAPRQCLNCGAEITASNTSGRPAKHCSAECCYDYNDRMRRIRRGRRAVADGPELTCPHCQKVFTPNHGGQKYCSHTCGRVFWQDTNNRKFLASPNKRCIICGTEFHGHKDQKCCSMDCSVIQRTKTAMATRIEKVCVNCGKVYDVDAIHNYSVACSKKCSDANWQRNNPDKRTRKLHRYNSKKYAYPYEDFDIEAIFERDGWICQICHKPVLRGVNGKHPLQPSPDHIVPISMGGPHIPSNVRCTHLKCNLERGNRTPAQLVLT